MQFLIGSLLAAAAITSASTNSLSDGSVCSLDNQEANTGAGHRSLIHRHTAREISHGASLSSDVNAAMAQHRRVLDKLVSELSGTNASQDEIPQAIKGLEAVVEVSGGWLEGHVWDGTPQTSTYDQWANTMNLRTICETGFNAGHSALRFLAQTKAQVYEFDLGEHPYSRPAAEYLNSTYAGRLHVTWGDSMRTVPEFRKSYPDLKCDLVIIDGGHEFEMATSDLLNLAKMASENALVSIDDTPCSAFWCDGPNRAWANFVANGCAANETKIGMSKDLGFTFARLRPCAHVQKDI